MHRSSDGWYRNLEGLLLVACKVAAAADDACQCSWHGSVLWVLLFLLCGTTCHCYWGQNDSISCP
jgi:uncharacterized membrane protein